jgi:hypothetical protein
MRVAIVEIMDSGHVALAEALCRIFSSEPGNLVTLFTLDSHAEGLNFLLEKYPVLSFTIKSAGQSIDDFLGEIASQSFDRVYIVTMTTFFPSFARWELQSSLYLVVHNLDEWFSISLLQNTGKFLSGIIKITGIKLFTYLIKFHFIIPAYRKKILRIISKTRGSVVVLSESVRKEAIKLKVPFNVEVVPFSVFDPPPGINENDSTKSLRICVPGIVSQYRRNYMALLEVVENQLGPLKDDFSLDFLGGIQPGNLLNDSGPVLDKVAELKLKGFSIIVHDTTFIPPAEYDRDLAQSDIIIGNMNVVLSGHSEYGRTKETGLPFAMIKAAKPGILPDNYPVPDEITSSTMIYKSYDELGKILIRLIKDRQSLSDLQRKALENSASFSPEKIYKRITKEL